MMGISFVDLLPEAMESLGFAQANIAFFVGVAFYAAIVFLMPDPDLGPLAADDNRES